MPPTNSSKPTAHEPALVEVAEVRNDCNPIPNYAKESVCRIIVPQREPTLPEIGPSEVQTGGIQQDAPATARAAEGVSVSSLM
jgi:hypothetical protein